MRITSGEEAIGGEDNFFHRELCNKAAASRKYLTPEILAGRKISEAALS
jgi:hypothetical protein